VAAAGDDIPELVAEVRLRNSRIRRLEADLAAARRSPAMVADILACVETVPRAAGRSPHRPGRRSPRYA
jgi:hypothetical protein